MGVFGRDFSGLGQEQIAGCCEYGDEHFVSMKDGEFLDGRGTFGFSRRTVCHGYALLTVGSVYVAEQRYTLLTYLLTDLLTYLITPWSRVLLEKLTGFAASQEIPRIFGTRRFITVLTSARPLFRCLLRGASSRNTPPSPPGDPSGGVVYLRIVLSPEKASRHVGITKSGL